ncbi:hypothetical protein HDU79_008846 [Rhizoclosmatium sp. JEL0117]|nr:hypothetical protein HDU79_008846 [Rhizoclosmatium sp. JEL0117]
MSQKLDALNSLLITLSQIDTAAINEEQQALEASSLLARVEELSVLIDAYHEECDRHESDLAVLNEKVKDEVTRRLDLERERDTLQSELDELQVSLFEEANNLVQNETQQRHMLEEREQVLEAEVKEVKDLLKREQVQLRELKIKMEKEYSSVLAAESASIHNKLQPIEELLLAEFKDFVAIAANTKLARLPTLQFMKNVIEDDVTPTLRFGGNPRTSTRKFLDAVSADLVIVQEMNPLQFSSWMTANQAIKDAITVRTDKINEARAAAAALSAAADAPPPSSLAGTIAPQYIPSTITRSRTNSEVPITHPTISAETTAAITLIANISVTYSHTVFQKSMVERVSAWTSSANPSAATTLSANASTTPGATQPSTSPTAPTIQDPKTDPLTHFPAFFVLQGCSTCGRQHIPLQHHFKITDPATLTSGGSTLSTPSSGESMHAPIPLHEGWIPICENCYDRLESVTRFYEFIRMLRTGVYSSRDVKDMFAEVGAMRRDMFLARVCGVSGKGLAAAGTKRRESLKHGRAGSTGSIFGSGGGSFRQLGSVSRLSNEVL